MNLSPQQQAVIAWIENGRGSAFVEAVAGSGKTLTLIEAIALTKGTVAFTAYNKKIAEEINAKIADRGNPESKNYDPRFAGIGNRVRVGTFHSFGFGAWRRANGAVKLDAREKEQRTAAHLQLPRQALSLVPQLISLAKQRGLGLFGAVEDASQWFNIIDHFDLAANLEEAFDLNRAVELAQKGLAYHREIANELIDFDDMIYMPVVTGMRLWENDWVFVDEAQDTNPSRRALARKMLRSNGRAIFVGDRHQAIYGFTGADSDAIDQIVRDFGCTTLPLTTTFRCPKAVVREAQSVVSHIQAHESAPEGSVLDCNDDHWNKLIAQSSGVLGHPAIGELSKLTASDAILCRNTKPLVQTAYRLIRQGVACHVEGKDIGVGLIKLVNKFSARSIEQLRERLEKHLEDQVAKLVAKGKETQAEAMQDRIETVFVIMDECKTLDELRSKVATMFLDTEAERKPTLTLSTVHKSKGREWERVFLMGRWDYMPSRWARQEWQLEQERNLVYVAVTRAKSELVYVPAPRQEPGSTTAPQH